MAITTIIFDLGGVILMNDDSFKHSKEFANYFDMPSEEMQKAWDSVWTQFKTGKITEDEFWYGFLKFADKNAANIDYAKTLYRKIARPLVEKLN